MNRLTQVVSTVCVDKIDVNLPMVTFEKVVLFPSFFFFFSFFFFTFYTALSQRPNWISQMRNLGCFLWGKPACNRVTLPNLWCMLGVLVFPKSNEVWHGLHDLMHKYNCMWLRMGMYVHRERFCTENSLWEKNPLPHRWIKHVGGMQVRCSTTEVHFHSNQCYIYKIMFTVQVTLTNKNIELQKNWKTTTTTYEIQRKFS